MRDLKELHWRSRGPQLPQTVLDAATLRIGAPLPETYRLFLSQVDGGRIGRGAFMAAEKNWQIGGFFPFADAAGLAEKLRKSGKLPQGYLPVAYAESPEKPLIYLELAAAGRMFLKPSAKSRWEDAGSVLRLGDSFAEFLDLLGDVSKDPTVVVNTDSLAAAPAPAPVAAAPAPVAAAKPKAAAKPAAATPGAKPITSPAAAAARAFAAAASAKNAAPSANHKRPLTPPAAKPTKLPAPAKSAPAAKAAPAAPKAPAKKAPAKKVAKAASAKAASKPTKPAAKKKPAAKAAKAKPAKAKVGARSRR
jgi:hypothetical protein